MSDAYRGDTVGKKIARHLMWTKVINALRACSEFIGTPDDPFSPKCRYLYLASHEGGDASVLASFGIRSSQQLAVDLDPKALEAFSAKWPEIETRCCDIATLKRAAHERFSIIYLDFCAHLSIELVRTIVQVVENCGRENCELVVAYMRGREKDDVTYDIESRMADDSPGVHDFVLKIGDTYASESTRGTIDGRSDFLTYSLNLALAKRRVIVPREVFTYQSRTERSPGVPMAIVRFLVCKTRRASTVLLAHRSQLLTQFAVDSGGGAVCMSADISPFWSDEHLRTSVLEWLEYDDWDVKRAALAFNIDPRTISAWKAHQTMGTYA